MQAPPNERKEFKSIGLSLRQWSFVKEVGRGSYGYGIRYIVEQAYKASATQLPAHKEQLVIEKADWLFYLQERDGEAGTKEPSARFIPDFT